MKAANTPAANQNGTANGAVNNPACSIPAVARQNANGINNNLANDAINDFNPKYDSIKKRSIIPIDINKIVAGKNGKPKINIFLYSKKLTLLKLISFIIIGLRNNNCTIAVSVKA